MWGITIGSTTQWSSTGSLSWSGLKGTNSWSVYAPSGYTANPSSGTISGAGSTTITFTGIPQIQVSINPQPTSGTAPLQVTLYAGWWNAPSGATYSYTINWGDGSTTSSSTTSTTGTFYHTYSSAGTYTITVTASAPGAQTGSASATVTVYAPITISFSANPTSGIAPLGVSFSGSWSGGSGGYSWTLSFGDGGSTSGSGSSMSASHTYSSAGTYTATLTVKDSAGNSASKSATITVTSGSVTFTESGLPSGVQWTVTVGGTPYSANSGQPIKIQCSSGQTISYTVNMVEDANGCFYYPNGQPSVSGTASCGATVSVTYQFEGCYYGGD
jgi:PKD repeat protein